jgi:hypothetical protein
MDGIMIQALLSNTSVFPNSWQRVAQPAVVTCLSLFPRTPSPDSLMLTSSRFLFHVPESNKSKHHLSLVACHRLNGQHPRKHSLGDESLSLPTSPVLHPHRRNNSFPWLLSHHHIVSPPTIHRGARPMDGHGLGPHGPIRWSQSLSEPTNIMLHYLTSVPIVVH